MGKICWINGQPYSAGLPTGGSSEDDCDDQWAEIINFLGEDCDSIFHWQRQYSWCQEKIDESLRTVRGYDSARYWDFRSASFSYPIVGFRPVLTPLSTDTLEPDPSLLTDIPDGQKIALASLYMDGKPMDLSGKRGFYYKNGCEVILGDRDKKKNNWLYVIKYKDLLWADRNILVDISWDELQKQGYAD